MMVIANNQKPNLLVVEDDLASQQLVKFFVQDDFKPHFASNVQDAKSLLRSEDIDMILLDLSLEGDENGLDLVAYLRESETWRDIPIIAATAHAFTSDKEKCMSAGCNDYMTKPMIQKLLMKTLNEYLVTR